MKPDYAAVEAAFEKLCDGCPLPLRVDIWIQRDESGNVCHTAMIQERSFIECATAKSDPMEAAASVLTKYKNLKEWNAKKIAALESDLEKLKGSK